MHILNRSPWSPNPLKTNMLINREVMQKKKIIIKIISLSWMVLYRMTTKFPPMRCVLFSIRTEESHDDKAVYTCSFGPNTEKNVFSFVQQVDLWRQWNAFFKFLTAGEVLGTGVIFLFGENKNQAQAKETVIDLVLRHRLVCFLSVVSITISFYLRSLTSISDQHRISSYNIKQASDEIIN